MKTAKEAFQFILNDLKTWKTGEYLGMGYAYDVQEYIEFMMKHFFKEEDEVKESGKQRPLSKVVKSKRRSRRKAAR